jgi:hypothetical protein
MPLYQTSAATASKLIVGNCKLETAAYASAAGTFTWVNCGVGMVKSAGYKPTMYNVQAGNAPDPIKGVADEVFSIEADLIEFDGSVLTAMAAGMLTGTSSTSVYTVVGGGSGTLTPRAFRLTNTSMIAGATKQTIMTVFYATLISGLSFTFKSDNDSDPLAVQAVTIEAELDTTRTAGSQLFSIVKTL